jgi:hypothetical protein
MRPSWVRDTPGPPLRGPANEAESDKTKVKQAVDCGKAGCSLTAEIKRHLGLFGAYEKGENVFQPYTTELARQRRCEMKQDADLYRQTKQTRAAKEDRKRLLHRLLGD